MKNKLIITILLLLFSTNLKSDEKDTINIIKAAQEKAQISRKVQYTDDYSISILFELEFPLVPTSNRNRGNLKVGRDFTKYVPLYPRAEIVLVDRAFFHHPWGVLALIVDREFALFLSEGPGREDLLSFNLLWSMLDVKIDLDSETKVRQYTDFFLRVRSNLNPFQYRINRSKDIWLYPLVYREKSSFNELFIKHVLDLFSEELLIENFEENIECQIDEFPELSYLKQITDKIGKVIEPITIKWGENKVQIITYIINAGHDAIEKLEIMICTDGYIERLDREVILENIGVREYILYGI